MEGVDMTEFYVDMTEEDEERRTDPVITVKEFTVKTVFDALEKNGFEHIREQWFNFTTDGKVAGACVLGQGALNLNVPHEMDEEINDDNQESFYWDDIPLGNWGDRSPTLVEQLNRFSIPRYSKWSETPDGGYHFQCGEAIIRWNDAHAYDEDGEPIRALDENGIPLGTPSNPIYEYALKTYKEVVDMAREVLEPHFNEILYLRVLPEGTYNIKLPS